MDAETERRLSQLEARIAELEGAPAVQKGFYDYVGVISDQADGADARHVVSTAFLATLTAEIAALSPDPDSTIDRILAELDGLITGTWAQQAPDSVQQKAAVVMLDQIDGFSRLHLTRLQS